MLDKIVLQKLSTNDVQLPKVSEFAIGNADTDKINAVINSYNKANNELLGACLEHILIGVIGYLQEASQIIIRHISILPKFQHQGIGTLLIDNIKQQYTKYKLLPRQMKNP